MTEPVVDQRRIEANWRAITIELDAPQPSRLERVLRRAGVPAPVTRMVAATPALRRAWYLSIVGVVVIGLGVADPTDRTSLFALLVMAPLLPVLGVALAYGSAADPAHEIQVATPTHGLRLVAIRTATVLVVSVFVVVLVTLTNDATRPYTAVWLLPALAVTAASLALMTIRPPRQAAAADGGGLARRSRGREGGGRRSARRVSCRRSTGGGCGHRRGSHGRRRPPRTVRAPGAGRMTAAHVFVEHLGMTFGPRVAVDDITLLAQGGITAVLGPNGCGKSTLLRCTATVLVPDRGGVRIDGLDPTREHERIEARRRLGYAPQDAGFAARLRVFDAVDYIAVLKGLGDTRHRRRAAFEALDRVGLAERAQDRVGDLSGGMRRRLVLAQALLGSPTLLVLDEPTAGLDPDERLRLRAILTERRHTSTVLTATHLTDDAAAADTVVVLDAGRASFVGKPTQLAAGGGRSCVGAGRVGAAGRPRELAAAEWPHALSRVCPGRRPPRGTDDRGRLPPPAGPNPDGGVNDRTDGGRSGRQRRDGRASSVEISCDERGTRRLSRT